MKPKAWILTSEYNEYDQQGDYFEAWFHHQPTKEDIAGVLSAYYPFGIPEGLCRHVLNGGGRQDVEHKWYILQEVESSNGSEV